MLDKYGAIIEDCQALNFYKTIRFHGAESAFHRHVKYAVFHAALRCNLYPFIEVPVHAAYSEQLKKNRIADLFILPEGKIIQIENCKKKKASKWAAEYYEMLYCRKYDTEVIVIDYTKYKKKLLEDWEKELIKECAFDGSTLNKYIKEEREKGRKEYFAYLRKQEIKNREPMGGKYEKRASIEGDTSRS